MDFSDESESESESDLKEVIDKIVTCEPTAAVSILNSGSTQSDISCDEIGNGSRNCSESNTNEYKAQSSYSMKIPNSEMQENSGTDDETDRGSSSDDERDINTCKEKERHPLTKGWYIISYSRYLTNRIKISMYVLRRRYNNVVVNMHV